MKPSLLTLLLALLCSLNAWAGSITGEVVDSDNNPLPFANVIAFQGDKLIKGTVTDVSGDFSITGLKNGDYTVKFQMMGYETQERTVHITDAKPNVKVGRITLSEESQQVAEVAVVAQKQTMKLDIDKKVFDVSQDIASVGGSASEVLENIPSVEVDSEGNISLCGSQSVTVWINGKAQGLTSDNRGDILDQLPSESIDHIEVITNPSSKYSPEGSSGIINIVLKRDRKAGYYGGLQLNINNEGGGRIGGNINLSSSLIDAYLNLGYGRRVHDNGGWTNRDFVTDDVSTGYLNSQTDGERTGNNFFVRTGLTWHITDKDDISAGYMGIFGNGNRESSIDYQSGNYGAFDLIDPYMRNRYTDNEDDMKMCNLDVSYSHQWKPGHSIEALFSKNWWTMDGDTYYDQNTYYYKDLPITGYDWTDEQLAAACQNSYQRQINTIKNGNTEVRLDYIQPIGEANKIEAGYNGTFYTENSPTETFEDEECTKSIQSLFNRFKYDSNVHALYANWNSRINQLFGYQIGLRGEWWTVETTSFDYQQEYSGVQPDKFSKNYSAIFPTAFISFALSETQEIQVNYTRRLQRPFGGQMNSFKNISDSTSISYGNPLLTPEYTNSLELNYLKTWDNHTLSASLYFRPSTDVIQRISYLDNGVRFETNENIAKSKSAGLELIAKNRFLKRFDLTSTINLFYYKLDGGTFTKTTDSGNEVDIVVDDDDDFSWNINEMLSVMLPLEITWQTTFKYDAPKVITQGKQEANYSLNMGLRKSFAQRKFNLALNCRDLLDSRCNHSKTSSTGFKQESKNWRGGRRFILQFSWNFGNMKAKEKKSKGGNIDSGYGEGGGDE